MLVVTYAGMVFSAMETDYFPRLSAACMERLDANSVVNRQAEVSVLLIAPMIVAFVLFSPIILPMLFSSKFLPVLGMIQVAALSMFFRALYLPIEYMSLAHGDSRSYCFLEGVNNVCMVAAVLVGYNVGALHGAGVGLALASAIELVFSYAYMRVRYGYRGSSSLLKNIMVQLPLVVAAIVVSAACGTVWRWTVLPCVLVASMAVSMAVLGHKTGLRQVFNK